MMTAESTNSYRNARRAFIAACEAAHVETVARLHPVRGADGKPLFMDCAAAGPRQAAKAVLAVAHDAAGSDMLIALVREPLLPDARLVLVHAYDPAHFVGIPGDPAWPAAMLGAVATEDLSHVRHIAILPLNRKSQDLEPVLRARVPDAAITVLPPASSLAKAKLAITRFFQKD
jgi:hypothetical protein